MRVILTLNRGRRNIRARRRAGKRRTRRRKRKRFAFSSRLSYFRVHASQFLPAISHKMSLQKEKKAEKERVEEDEWVEVTSEMRDEEAKQAQAEQQVTNPTLSLRDLFQF